MENLTTHHFQVEERRTVRDSDGNETTTVTRQIGGKSETTTTTRKSDGSEDRHIENFGSETISKFFGKSKESARSEVLKPIPESEQPTYKSIFSKFFGN